MNSLQTATNQARARLQIKMGSIQEVEDAKDDAVITEEEEQELPKYMGKRTLCFPHKQNCAKDCP